MFLEKTINAKAEDLYDLWCDVSSGISDIEVYTEKGSTFVYDDQDFITLMDTLGIAYSGEIEGKILLYENGITYIMDVEERENRFGKELGDEGLFILNSLKVYSKDKKWLLEDTIKAKNGEKGKLWLDMSSEDCHLCYDHSVDLGIEYIYEDSDFKQFLKDNNITVVGRDTYSVVTLKENEVLYLMDTGALYDETVFYLNTLRRVVL